MLLKLRAACRVLAAGGVIACPTESVWGLSCDPRNVHAVQKLLQMKHRDWRKGLILIAADFAQLTPFVKPVAAELLKTALDRWPGPYTWLFPAAKTAPDFITGGRPTIAVRVTAHPLAAALCRAYRGALVSTSANFTGRAPARSAAQIRQQFGRSLDALLAGKLGGLRNPTPIRDLLSGKTIRG